MKLRRRIKLLNRFARMMEQVAKARGKKSFTAHNTRSRVTILRTLRSNHQPIPN